MNYLYICKFINVLIEDNIYKNMFDIGMETYYIITNKHW